MTIKTNKKEKVIGVIWSCDKCKSVMISSSLQHHQIDYCMCKKSAIDLEEYYMRMIGYPLILKIFKNGKWMEPK